MPEKIPARVIVAIPTFRRPQNLQRLLGALARMTTRARVSVLVADNDAEARQGLELCARLRASYPWPLEAILAPQRGIAQVRNALVEKALADPDAAFIAMIDDDEWPQEEWLDELLRVQDQTGADVVQGSIRFGGEGHDDIRRPTGPIAMLQGAGNLLIARPCLEEIARPWFDPAFALTGGEDRDFFVRLQGLGKRFAWADKACAWGEIPATRRTLGWIARRAYSIGNSDMRVLLKHRPGMARILGEGAKIAGALLLSPILLAILGLVPNRRVRPLQKFFRAAGKLAAMFGAQYNEYSVIHGE